MPGGLQSQFSSVAQSCPTVYDSMNATVWGHKKLDMTERLSTQSSTVCLLHLLIHLSINERLACFHTLAVVNNTTVDIAVHISFQISVFLFFG